MDHRSLSIEVEGEHEPIVLTFDEAFKKGQLTWRGAVISLSEELVSEYATNGASSSQVTREAGGESFHLGALGQRVEWLLAQRASAETASSPWVQQQTPRFRRARDGRLEMIVQESETSVGESTLYEVTVVIDPSSLRGSIRYRFSRSE